MSHDLSENRGLGYDLIIEADYFAEILRLTVPIFRKLGTGTMLISARLIFYEQVDSERGFPGS